MVAWLSSPTGYSSSTGIVSAGGAAPPRVLLTIPGRQSRGWQGVTPDCPALGFDDEAPLPGLAPTAPAPGGPDGA
eukprot:4657814-Alexandrium_andersonii.AAC.1